MPGNYRWTVAEDRQLRELSGEGTPAPEVAAILGRSTGAVEKRRAELGIRMGMSNRPDAAARARVIGYLGRGMTLTDIAARVQRHPTTVYRMVRRLVAEGLVERTGGPRRAGRYAPAKRWYSRS